MLRRTERFARTLFERLVVPRRFARDFLLGLPAVLLFLGFIGATAGGHLRQRDSAQHYWVLGEQELQAGNPQVAQIYLQKAIVSDQADRRDIVFALARAYEASEDFDRAKALMESLASVGKAGHPPAHRYLALRIAHQIAQTKRADDLEAWHWHLSHADQTDSAELQRSWALYFLIRGDLEKARMHTRRAAEREPALWMQVARLDARLKDRDALVQTLKTARQRLEQSFRQDPTNTQVRLLYVTSLMNVSEFAEAERVLTEGLQESDSQALRQLLAVVSIKRYDIAAQDPEQGRDALEFLRTALDCDPGSRPALTRLVRLARSTPERLQETRAMLQQSIAAGNASAMAHFTLGTLEWLAGNAELAEASMRQAIALNDRLPVVANNLAYLMAQSDDGDLAAALALAEQAVQADIDSYEYRDTRGFILEKLGRLSEAAVDYQHALETAADPVPLQQKLASVYDRLGDSERAAEYRSAAQRSSTKPPESGLQL